MNEKVWIVLEGPDMTYYGDAEIHGVFTNEAAARMRAIKVYPTWAGEDWQTVGVGEYEVETTAEPVKRCPVCEGKGYLLARPLTARETIAGIGARTEKCTACDGQGWQPL